MTIESLTKEVNQFNKKFKSWKDGPFKELSTKVDDLVGKTHSLVEQSGVMIKQSKQINILLEGMISNTDEIIKRLDKLKTQEADYA